MLRERALGETLWESVPPAEVRELPPELKKVDDILDDDRFLAPFRDRLTARTGRPTIPIESYLKILRDLRLVRGRRAGRHVRYELYDHHVVDLLAAVRHHREHVHPPAPVELPRRPREPA